jgi:thioredoxin 1
MDRPLDTSSAMNVLDPTKPMNPANPVKLPEIGPGALDRTLATAPEAVLVCFTAAWCPPCRALKPLLVELQQELDAAGRPGAILTVDVDDDPAAAARFGIRAAPTLVAFAGGRPVASQVGLATKERLRALLDAAVSAG